MTGVPPAEVRVDPALVRRLLAAQHPDLADRDAVRVAEGWDNVTFRLGDDLAVRLPRRAVGADLLQVEQRWLRTLAALVPGVALPVPERIGEPDAAVGYPWPWSVVPWIAGETVDRAPLGPDGAVALGCALRALHVPAPPDAPDNPFRACTLAERPDPLRGPLPDGVDGDALARIWAQAVALPAPEPPAWIHGDLHVRNLLGTPDGDLAGILDWGDTCAGDPAVDLTARWTVLDPAVVGAFDAAYGDPDDALLDRARGWAIVFGRIVLDAHEGSDPGFAAVGRSTLARVAADAG